MNLSLATLLALVAAATLAERVAFTGILTFDSEYRVVATFSSMHLGGGHIGGGGFGGGHFGGLGGPRFGGAGFRAAPLSTTAAVVGGFLLMRLLSGLPERAIFAVLQRYKVFDHHFNAYVLFASDGVAIGHVIALLFVGCMVGLAAKGREMVATTTLALILCAMMVAALVWISTHQPVDVAWMLWSCADPLAIVIGGAIVRTRRPAAKPLPLGA